ncbi:B12-binding domain-containing radical SAM protein [Vibrio natriegens]|uniref:B12-binding domain-containing radical SAM protein n=1 Tax=Vibrio natriegens TaxID=691 RepID=UPI0008047543|nr:hypothetical protein [Vibrio natriegens]ANQ17348.1 hypothetical protein BA891_08945 [Vibrio natriegens]
MNPTRVSLIFPPFSESALHGPHLAIPLLRGYLEIKNTITYSHDLNIQTINKLIERNSIITIKNIIKNLETTEEKVKFNKAIDLFLKKDINLILNANSNPLKTFLGMIRNLLFPLPDSLDDCINNNLIRNKLSSDIYTSLIDEVLSNHPSVICFTVAFSEQLLEAIELAKIIREKNKNVEIWIGGSQINLLEKIQIETIKYSGFFDRVSIGNGEQNIYRMLEDKRSIENSILKNDCKIYLSPKLDPEDINIDINPIFEDNLCSYFRPLSLPVLVTKGCYWGKCTFCDYPRLSNLGELRYISKKPKLVFDEIKRLNSKFNPDQINLISDAVPPNWYKKLCTLAIDDNFKLNTWSYMMHHKSLDNSYFSLLSKAGVKAINFGTESMIDRVLDVMRKQANSSEISSNLQSAYNNEISVVCNVIPDYPTISRKEAYDNFLNFYLNRKFIDSINPQMFDLTAGSEVSKKPSLFGLELNTDAYLKSSHGYHSMDYSRRDELKKTDREILKKAFFRLKTLKQIERREDALSDNGGNSYYQLDGSIVFLNDNKVWVMSLGTEWKISNSEYTALRTAIEKWDGYFSEKMIKELDLDFDLMGIWKQAGIVLNTQH